MLKRIAEDRRSLQEKNHSSAAAEAPPPPAACQGEKLEKKIQTNTDSNCVLMVRLFNNNINISCNLI